MGLLLCEAQVPFTMGLERASVPNPADTIIPFHYWDDLPTLLFETQSLLLCYLKAIILVLHPGF